MFRNIVLILSVLLCQTAFAQEALISGDVGLGQEVPNFDVNVFTDEGTHTINSSELRGKVVILEFWATYCGPCLPAMDHLSAIAAKFPEDLRVFAITEEPRYKVKEFIARRPVGLPIGLDSDHQLNSLFYHQFMPHTVIIGPDGYLKAITSPDQVTDEVIYMARSGAELNLETKAEFKKEATTAFVPIATEDQSLFKVEILPQRSGAQSQVNKKSANEYEFINCTVPMIYQALYQAAQPNPAERPCLEVTQQTKYLLEENYQYCLKLKVPENLQSRLPEIGMRELEEVFAIRTENELRPRNVYSLVLNNADSTAQAAEAGGGQITIRQFIDLLWETRLVDKPITNDSGMPDETVIQVEIPTQVYEVNERLASLGFKLEPKTKQMGCLILHEN